MRAAPRSGLESKRPYRVTTGAASSGALDGLPPLASLRVFEACARRRSLAGAAEELCVSASTVTHHIRAVEKWAGGALFARRGARVVLTKRAESALRDLQHAFSYIAAGAEHLKQPPASRTSVAVSVAPSLASKWLLPRLERFTEQHPEIEIWVAASTNLVDFGVSDVDLAIRYGPGAYAGLNSEKLSDEWVAPVAAPDIVRRFGPFETPSDYLCAPLLHDTSVDDPACPNWDAWFAAQGAPTPGTLNGPRFDQSNQVLDHAIAGKGVALAKLVLAEPALKAGQLERLCPDSTRLDWGYWLVWPAQSALSPSARIFADWLIEEFNAPHIAAKKV